MRSLEIIQDLYDTYRSYRVSEIDNSISLSKQMIKSKLQGPGLLYSSIIRIAGSSYGQKALCLIENNHVHQEAIISVNLSLMYAEVAIDLELKEFGEDPFDEYASHSFKKNFSSASALLYWAILMDNHNLAKKLARQVIYCLEQKTILKGFPLSYDYFALWAYFKWAKIEPSLPLLLETAFKELTDNWSESSPKLYKQVKRICDIHCKELVDNDGKKFPAKLLLPPLTLLPLEVHVINKLRLLEGLDAIHVDHPLMHTNSAKIKDFKIVEDDFLEEIQLSL
ncbi:MULTISPECIES: hypothetical protein [Acinetobacter]|jgi:hypothetical protein|uniref:hypothetical protein n=1 Tax=Acinetobacter TaxID=469 RepID=UPI000C3F2BF1|nr:MULTISPECIES: hypothetical protein [Acinetobacter]MBC70673.1 hypothetical protein [Acinetobacter sp.]MBT51574.1 hypothetical protein [Acinetobacter sp.]HIQ35680.1 hypothetical protein [Acinetobacter venetianus]